MWWIIGLSIFILAIAMFLRFNSQFGGSVSPTLLSRYAKSPQWDGKKFVNQSPTVMDINLASLPGLIREQLSNTAVRSPRQPLPILPFNETLFQSEPDTPKFVWYGHSVLLLQIHGRNLLIDPMLGPDAAPIAPFASRRFSKNALEVIDHLPPLDAVLMTHDHYDHLDHASIQRLKSKTDTWLVALGVGRHLERWGISPDQITEFDWWQELDFHGITLTFTPSRHFSGRGLTDRAKSLWGGWVFTTKASRIYWSGDGGYDGHFAEVGKRLGPFDWAFMECGQYNERWHAIHMYPEEAVQAAQDAGAKVSIPVHWGGFALALHTWQDPAERFWEAAQTNEVEICTPQIGEVVLMGQEAGRGAWWREVE